MSEGFLSRWSRLKRSGVSPAPEEPAPPTVEPAQEAPRGIWSNPSIPGVPAAGLPATDVPSPQVPADPAQDNDELAAPAPALPPVESLDFDADFKPFMRTDVAPATRNAALRKLFSDPSFNVMDGLDIYIDDYSLPDPIPDEMLRGLVQSQTLGLFSRNEQEAPAPDSSALAVPGPTDQEVAGLPVAPDPSGGEPVTDESVLDEPAPGPRIAVAPEAVAPGPLPSQTRRPE